MVSNDPQKLHLPLIFINSVKKFWNFTITLEETGRRDIDGNLTHLK